MHDQQSLLANLRGSNHNLWDSVPRAARHARTGAPYVDIDRSLNALGPPAALVM